LHLRIRAFVISISGQASQVQQPASAVLAAACRARGIKMIRVFNHYFHRRAVLHMLLDFALIFIAVGSVIVSRVGNPQLVVSVTVTYRRTDLLQGTIRAIAAQTRPPDVILVIDNADMAVDALANTAG